MNTDREQLFAQLLANTPGQPHGIMPNYQEDDLGSLWHYIAITTPATAHNIIQGVLGLKTPIYMPENTEYIIFRGDDTYLYAVTASHGKYYLIRTEAHRYYHKLLRDYRDLHVGIRQQLLQALSPLYGSTSTNLQVA